jgi:hypothetical protein
MKWKWSLYDADAGIKMCLRLPSKAKIAGLRSHKIINGRILTYQYSKTSISPPTLTGIMKNRSPLCLFYDCEAAEGRTNADMVEISKALII